VRRGKLGFWYRLVVVVLKPLLLLFTKRDWRGRENVPRTGGVILAINHISYVDPLTVSHFVHDLPREPRFLAKVEIFRLPLLGRVVRGAEQIPVHRNSADAAVALRDAVEALERGECLIIYPEGTVTRDPELWPMVGRTGVARLALTTGCPVVPVAQWGAHEILMPYAKRPHLLPRKTVHYSAGPPVDLSPFAGKPLTADVLRAATDTVMAAIRALLADLRGEPAPADVWDRGLGRRVPSPAAGERWTA
jgi:1-acyl-sn-glycerol-3-phosphate acyltransferase